MENASTEQPSKKKKISKAERLGGTVKRSRIFVMLPTTSQISVFEKNCELSALTYNWAVSKLNRAISLLTFIPNDDLEKSGKWEGPPVPSKFTLSNELTKFINHPINKWMKELDSDIPRAALDDVYSATAGYLARKKKGDKTAKRPSYRRLSEYKSFGFKRLNGHYPTTGNLNPASCYIKRLNKRIGVVKLPKIGEIKIIYDSDLPDISLGTAKVRLNKTRWELSIQFDVARKTLSEDAVGKVVGIDRGVSVPAYASDGSVLSIPEKYKTLEQQKKKIQRQMARSPSNIKNAKKSNRWLKKNKRLNKITRKQTLIKNYAIHNFTAGIVSANQFVVLEDLKVQKMTKSASGTVDNPGTNVTQKKGLNRGILASGWGELSKQLEYKLDGVGGSLYKVNPAYTSQRCNACGHVSSDNRSGEKFHCVSCGHEDHADANAAKNIRESGIKEFALKGDF